MEMQLYSLCEKFQKESHSCSALGQNRQNKHIMGKKLSLFKSHTLQLYYKARTWIFIICRCTIMQFYHDWLHFILQSKKEMVMIDIFKPLSTFLQPVTPINLGNKDQTWDCWARSENVTSVPCSPPMAPFLSYHLMPEKEKKTFARHWNQT